VGRRVHRCITPPAPALGAEGSKSLERDEAVAKLDKLPAELGYAR
jgi:hypothetical protein